MTSGRGIAFATLLFATVASCTRQTGESGASASTSGSSTRSGSSTLVVTHHGIGPLRFGMTIAEAKAAVPSLEVPEGLEKESCDYTKAKELPEDIEIMVEDGRVTRIDVYNVDVKTAEGARIRDTEERVESLYPGRVTVGPHKYSDGHYLTIRPVAPADSAFGIVFETDSGKVMNYRAGLHPSVDYVERCL